jgi:hypothetical protein
MGGLLRGHGIKEEAVSYQNIYLAEKLHEHRERRLQRSLEIARLLREGTGRRFGVADWVLIEVGEALICLGRRLKEWSAPGGDLAPDCG